jgi:hypothetical protein
MRNFIAGVPLVFGLLGCAQVGYFPPEAPAPMLLPPPAALEYASARGTGSATLTGQAFLTTRGGDVKVAAGRMVTLDPATPYALAWYEKYGRVLARVDELPPEPAFATACRTTQADAQGRFKFAGLAPGRYIARSTVTWETGAAYAGTQGGVVSDVVDVSDGQGQEVMLTRTSDASGARLTSLEELRGKPYRMLKQVKGESCNSSGVVSSSEADARAALSKAGADESADAVINIVCKKGGMSLSRNCWSYWECSGDGILFT